MPKTTRAWLILASATVAGQAVAVDTDYYHGKNVTYIVATNAGGGYDAYARLIGGYLQKHLAADNVIIRNVPGAGHIIGANTLWRSRKDGLTLGTFNAGLIYGQLLGQKVMQFDLREFEWIGKAAGEPRAIVASENCPIKRAEQLLAAEDPILFGSAGIGSASYNDMMLLADALEIKVKVIAGFDGTEGEMSMMRGEICAILGSSSSFLDFVNAGYGFYILTIGGHLDGVPNARDFAQTERARRLISIIEALAELGRISAAPPGTPAVQVAALRAAYRSSLEDPALLEEARRMGRPIEPAFGDDVRKLIVDALDQPPEIIAQVEKAINGNAR